MENNKKHFKKPNKKKNDKKAQINNEIIQNQGKFKQAKVATIRKIVEKLKHPEKNPKQNRTAKVERYQNVLNQLKHMPPKRLGLLALIYYKSGKNYLSDPNSTVEQLAVGYFCEHKCLNTVLDSTRNKLRLNDSSDWRKSVKKLFKKKDKTLEAEKIQKKTPFTETDSPSVNTKPKVEKGKAKPKSDGNNKPEAPTGNAVKQQKKQKESAKQKIETAIDSDESSDSEQDEQNAEDSHASEAKATEAPTTIDDFFITADGSNYLSTAVANKNQDEDSDGGSNSRSQHGKTFKTKESSFFQTNGKNPVKLAANRFEGTKRKWLDEGNEQDHKEKQPKIDTDLHPSWQAKQKLKPSIAEFKGKKITFD